MLLKLGFKRQLDGSTMSDCYDMDEDAILELMDYAHYGEENPLQKEVDVIFEEVVCDT